MINLAAQFADESNGQIEIRTANSEADYWAAVDIMVAAYGKYQWVRPESAFIIHRTEIFDLRRRIRSGEVLLATEGGHVLGVALWQRDPGADDSEWPRRWASVRTIAMPPKSHPYDVGGALLAGCAAKAQAQGAIALCLHMAEPGDVRTSSSGLELRRVPQLDFVALGTDHGLGETDRMTVRAYALPLQ